MSGAVHIEGNEAQRLPEGEGQHFGSALTEALAPRAEGVSDASAHNVGAENDLVEMAPARKAAVANFSSDIELSFRPDMKEELRYLAGFLTHIFRSQGANPPAGCDNPHPTQVNVNGLTAPILARKIVKGAFSILHAAEKSWKLKTDLHAGSARAIGNGKYSIAQMLEGWGFVREKSPKFGTQRNLHTQPKPLNTGPWLNCGWRSSRGLFTFNRNSFRAEASPSGAMTAGAVSAAPAFLSVAA